MINKIELTFTDYKVQGTALLALWGGGKATIEMKSYRAKNKKEAIEGINDNGFGVQRIDGATIEMIPNYDGWLDWENAVSFDWKNEGGSKII